MLIIEFHQKIAKMLIMGELRIEAIEDNHEIRLMEGQERLSEVNRVQPTTNRPSKLILVKPYCTNKGDHNAMPYNYSYTSNIRAPLPLFQAEIIGLTRSGW